LVDYADEIDPTWLDGVGTVGVTSGASVPEVLVRDTGVYLLATWRGVGSTILPHRLTPAARHIRETIERYQHDAGNRFDLASAIARAREVETAASTLDDLLDRARANPVDDALAAIANGGARAVDRILVTLSFTAHGPFDQDLALPIPAVPLLAPVRQLKDLDPTSNDARFLTTELVRNRNRVVFTLREALRAAEDAIEDLRKAV
jgi:DNA-directed RNA polymerase subunit K/omega